MTLTALQGVVPIGSAQREFRPLIANLSGVNIDAANEASIDAGQIYWTDGGTHTIDTTGSSLIEWRTNTVTFANAGTTVVVGLAAIDMAAGPPVRAVNVSDVITPSVSKTMIGGGGGIATVAWQQHVPDTGTMTIANGDEVAFFVQMTTRGGADLLQPLWAVAIGATLKPSVTTFLGGAYADATRIPNCVLTASDGTLGFFVGGHVSNGNPAIQTWNNGSAAVEFGNLITLPFPANIYGLYGAINPTGNFDFLLYSDPLGTPVAEKTISFDANAVGETGHGYVQTRFPAPYAAPAGSYASIIKPTTVTDVACQYKILFSAAHQVAENGNGYAVSRASGAFAAVNSSKNRFSVGLLVGAFDDAGGVGAPGHANMSGGML